MTTTPSIRVTQYRIGPGEFAGSTYDLELNRPLLPDYFVLIAGTVQDTGGAVGPGVTAVRVSGDQHGTGDLTTTGGNVLRLERGALSVSPDWQGVIQVVECERDQEGSGFRLLDVPVIIRGAPGVVGLDAVAYDLRVGFVTPAQGTLLGGLRVGGASVSSGALASQHPSVAARIYTDGTDINVDRYDGTGAALVSAGFSLYQVEWGSEWTVQRANVTGAASGSGSTIFHWNGAAITGVAKAETWLLGNGWTANANPDDSAAGMMIELGTTVPAPLIASSVATNYRQSPGSSSSELVALTHPGLVVDHVKDVGGATDWTHSTTVAAPIEPEEHLAAPLADGRHLSITTGRRLANVWRNSEGAATTDYPIPSWHAHHADDTTLVDERSYALTGLCRGRLQSIDFGGVALTAIEVTAGALQVESTDAPESSTSLVLIPDHEDLAVEDLIGELRMPRITALVRAMAAGAQVMEDQTFALIVDRDLNTATGKALQQWGAIVGEQPGGLDDDTYRRFIQARILANRSGGSTDELIAIWKLVVAPYVSVTETPLYPAGLQLVVVRDLPMSAEQARRVGRIMLGTARPSGISIDLIEAVTGYLGFDGDPDASPLDIGTLARSIT